MERFARFLRRAGTIRRFITSSLLRGMIGESDRGVLV